MGEPISEIRWRVIWVDYLSLSSTCIQSHIDPVPVPSPSHTHRQGRHSSQHLVSMTTHVLHTHIFKTHIHMYNTHKNIFFKLHFLPETVNSIGLYFTYSTWPHLPKSCVGGPPSLPQLAERYTPIKDMHQERYQSNNHQLQSWNPQVYVAATFRSWQEYILPSHSLNGKLNMLVLTVRDKRLRYPPALQTRTGYVSSKSLRLSRLKNEELTGKHWQTKVIILMSMMTARDRNWLGNWGTATPKVSSSNLCMVLFKNARMELCFLTSEISTLTCNLRIMPLPPSIHPLIFSVLTALEWDLWSFKVQMKLFLFPNRYLFQNSAKWFGDFCSRFQDSHSRL